MGKNSSRKDQSARPTLRQVAKMAGVSLATASNALNQKPGVNKDTIARVNHAARETRYLDYFRRRPDAETRFRAIRLITFRKHGLVMQDVPFFTELIQGLEEYCSDIGYELVFSQVTSSGNGDEQKLKQLLRDDQLATLLLATEMTADDLVLLEGAKSPLVILDSYFPQANFWTVGIANIEAGYKAGEYLIKNGHRTIGLITSNVQFNNMDERQNGFRQALAQAGLDLQPRFQVNVEPTINGCENEFKRWLDQANSLPDAFFACNDAMAAGAIRALHIHGIKIPEDISIIGMDNTSICQIVSPRLTSLNVYKKDLAQQAVSLLIERTKSRPTPRRYLQLGVDLVERDSVIGKL